MVIALLAPVTLVIAEASRLARQGGAVGSWLEQFSTACEIGAETYNRVVNPGGVAPVSPGERVSSGSGLVGEFVLLGDGFMTGSWSAFGGYRPEEHAQRVLGVLVAAAEWVGAADALPHAAEILSDGTDRIDFTLPKVATELPHRILEYSAQAGALHRMATEGPPDASDWRAEPSW